MMTVQTTGMKKINDDPNMTADYNVELQCEDATVPARNIQVPMMITTTTNQTTT